MKGDGRGKKDHLQCASTWRGWRCDKEAGHFALHSARTGDGPGRVAWPRDVDEWGGVNETDTEVPSG